MIFNKDKQKEHTRTYYTKKGIKTVKVNKGNKKEDKFNTKLGLGLLTLGGIGLAGYMNRKKIVDMFDKELTKKSNLAKDITINNNLPTQLTKTLSIDATVNSPTRKVKKLPTNRTERRYKKIDKSKYNSVDVQVTMKPKVENTEKPTWQLINESINRLENINNMPLAKTEMNYVREFPILPSPEKTFTPLNSKTVKNTSKSKYTPEKIPDYWLEELSKESDINIPKSVDNITYTDPPKLLSPAKPKLELDNPTTKTKSIFVKPKSKNRSNIVESKVIQARKASNEALNTELDRMIPVDSKIIDKFNEYIKPKYAPKSAIPKIDLVEYNPKRTGIKSNKRLDRDLFRDEFEKLPTEMQVATKLNMLKHFAPESYNSKSTLTDATVEMYDNLYSRGIENNLGHELSDHNSRVITGILLRNDGNLSKHLQRRKLLGLDKLQKLTAEIPEKLNNLEKATDDELKYISEGLKEFTNDLDNAAKEIEKRTKGQKYKLASEDEWAKYLGYTVIKGNVAGEYALSKRKALGIVSPEMEEVLRQVAVTKGNQGFLQRLLDDLDEHGHLEVGRRDLMTMFKRRLQHETLRNIRVTVGRVKRGVQNIGKIAISKDRKLAELRKLAKGRINKPINQWTPDDFLVFGDKYKEAQRLWEEYNILNNEFLVERGLNKIMNLFKVEL